MAAGQLRIIRRRIRTIQSTAKITRAMELVAASKMRRAQLNALAGRPYAERLRFVLADLAETIPLIDPTASSSCEIVFRLLLAMGGPIPDGAAACLYAGLVTDTGRFQYEATTPETLRVAATLREHAFDHSALAQALYEDNRREYLRLAGVALSRSSFEPEADLVWTYLTRSDMAQAGVHPAETDDLIDLIRTARDVDVAAVLKQQRDGRFKVSVRSRGRHDLATVAAAFGGGGHRLAAGYTSNHGPAGTISRLVEALQGDPIER